MDKDQKLLSIIIPVYNVENYLRECVESIVLQQYNPTEFEIILIDDGSTDDSGKICENLKNYYNDFDISVVHQDNKGLLAARRFGYKLAKGTFIVNVDSDDKLCDNALFKISETIRKTNADMIIYNVFLLEKHNTKSMFENVYTDNKEGCFVTKEQVISSFFLDEKPVVISMCNKVFKRELLDLNTDYSMFGNMSTGEDTLQSAELILNAKTFYYLNENLYFYRQGTGMTSRFNKDYYIQFVKILTYIREKFNSYDLIADNKLFFEKILFLGCRSITQTRNEKKLSFKQRRDYILSVANEKTFNEALNSLDLCKTRIKLKYRLIAIFIKSRLYDMLCLLLSI